MNHSDIYEIQWVVIMPKMHATAQVKWKQIKSLHNQWLHGLTIVLSAAINMDVQVSLCMQTYIPLDVLPRSAMTGSYGSPIFIFNLGLFWFGSTGV
jgi:hypothetical protein